MTVEPEEKSPFLQRVRAAIRVRHYSVRTEKSYVRWIVRFIRYHHYRHPEDMAEPEVAEFLSYLATRRSVAAATQNQAFNALVFLYKAVLDRPLGDLRGLVRAKQPQRLPTVLTSQEVRCVLRFLDGNHWLAACLMP
jgi:site-specific recombinase XerD